MTSNFKIIKTSQTQDTPLSSIEDEAFWIQYLSYQSQESKSTSQPGQDYISFMTNGSKLTFAVCDGVGGSFVGDLASKFLGDKLVEYFWSLDDTQKEYWFGSEQKLKDIITKAMRGWVDQAQSFVRNYNFPAELSELHKKGLEALRDEQGSESVFCAGIINRTNNNYSVLIISAGDVEYRLYDPNDEIISTNEKYKNNRNRWSTRWGFKGEINIYRLPPNRGFARLLVFTDGFNKYVSKIGRIDSITTQNALNSSSAINADDISILEIRIKDILNTPKDTVSQNKSEVSPTIDKHDLANSLEPINHSINKQTRLNELLQPPEISLVEIKEKLTGIEIELTLKPTKPKTYEFYVSPGAENENLSSKFTIPSSSEKITLQYSGKYSLSGELLIKGRSISGNNNGQWSKVYTQKLGKNNLNPKITKFMEDGEIRIEWREYVEAKAYEFSPDKFFWRSIKIRNSPYISSSPNGRVRAILNNYSTTNGEEISSPYSESHFSTIEKALLEVQDMGKELNIKYPLSLTVYANRKKKWMKLAESVISMPKNYTGDQLLARLDMQIKKLLYEGSHLIYFNCVDRYNREYWIRFT